MVGEERGREGGRGEVGGGGGKKAGKKAGKGRGRKSLYPLWWQQWPLCIDMTFAPS